VAPARRSGEVAGTALPASRATSVTTRFSAAHGACARHQTKINDNLALFSASLGLIVLALQRLLSKKPIKTTTANDLHAD
jgi:hypothetical protein